MDRSIEVIVPAKGPRAGRPDRVRRGRGRGLGGSSDGMTLLDTIVAMAIFSIVIAGLYVWLISTTKAAGTISQRSNLAISSARALERISGRLIGAGVNTLSPANPSAPLGTSSLAFRRGAGFADGQSIWELPMRIQLCMDEGEIENGKDDDGDGLIDEGQIRFIIDEGSPTERCTTIVHGVARYWGNEIANGIDDNGNGLIDESGLSFELAGDSIRVRLSLEVALPQGGTARTDVETTVQLRN